jgi:hypothetical protein
MSEAQLSSVSSLTSVKSPSSKFQSPNEGNNATEFVSNRDQKKSEERQGLKAVTLKYSDQICRRKCKKKDDDYLAMREEIVSLAKALHRTDAVRTKMWLTKLDETLSLLTWKINRNQYAALMIKQ